MFNLVVTVIFVLEFMLKLFGFGFVHYLRDAWNCLDFFIVVVGQVMIRIARGVFEIRDNSAKAVFPKQ